MTRLKFIEDIVIIRFCLLWQASLFLMLRLYGSSMQVRDCDKESKNILCPSPRYFERISLVPWNSQIPIILTLMNITSLRIHGNKNGKRVCKFQPVQIPSHSPLSGNLKTLVYIVLHCTLRQEKKTKLIGSYSSCSYLWYCLCAHFLLFLAEEEQKTY